MIYKIILIKEIEILVDAANHFDCQNKAKQLEKDGLKCFSFDLDNESIILENIAQSGRNARLSKLKAFEFVGKCWNAEQRAEQHKTT